jgi:hypothetical protein
MPQSRKRKQDEYTPVTPVSRVPVKLDSARWVAPVMSTLLVVGLLYIVVFYVAGQQIAFMANMGAMWNIVIGFGIMAVGFVIATFWK